MRFTGTKFLGFWTLSNSSLFVLVITVGILFLVLLKDQKPLLLAQQCIDLVLSVYNRWLEKPCISSQGLKTLIHLLNMRCTLLSRSCTNATGQAIGNVQIHEAHTVTFTVAKTTFMGILHVNCQCKCVTTMWHYIGDSVSLNDSKVEQVIELWTGRSESTSLESQLQGSSH